ncbi:BQ5605_C011g06521 [Microbotryum silenes-dioicae]|uniref:ATP-dependent DNA helicase n=1 Tax=Microbotryum silenes-dioicae TaxID=796604 RepID=A0A2X0LSM5_9BASI|nr:BQ5605_C011g06521 [Microbotryum silenes-dioicae]
MSTLELFLHRQLVTLHALWSRELRLTIPWQILNVLVRWGDHRVGRKSEAMPSRYSTDRFRGVTVVLAAMPSRYSTARFGGVTVVLAGMGSEAMPARYSQVIPYSLQSFHKDPFRCCELEADLSRHRDPKQCLPIIPKSSPTQIVDFVDAPGGTGKTFPEETVLARLRSEGTYALAVASSGIAAQLLPKGSTAHSRFKIPIDIFDGSTCNVPRQGQLAELWDEAPMQHRRCFQPVDRMLQDLRSSTARFGGLTVVLTGDPKQCLPVIPKSLASWNADFCGEVEMDNIKNTDSCTTSRRSEDQQQHCQWERPERERSGPVRSHTVLCQTLPLPHQHRRIILLPEDLGHINCGDSGKGSK